MGKPCALLARAGLLAFAALLSLSCARGRPSASEPGALPPIGSQPLFLEFLRGPSGATLVETDPAFIHASTQPLPWPEALAVSSLNVLDGRIAAALNRGGLGFLGLESGAIAWDCPGDAAFTDRSIVSAWCAEGRFWAFLAEISGFGARSEGDDAPLLPSSRPLLLSRAPGEGAYRFHELPWQAGSEWITTYLAPESADSFLIQLSRIAGRFVESRYFRARIDGSDSADLSQGEYLSALEPLPPSRVDASIRALCHPDEASLRYSAMEGFPEGGAAVLLSMREAGGWSLSSFLRGEPASVWTAVISAWKGEAGSAALHPGGGLFLSQDGASAQIKRIALPALPATFDYEGIAGTGELWVAAWSQTVFPVKGRSGLVVVRPE